MILGGIPYYMSYFEEDLSLGQNVDRLFFKKDAVLANEYDRLFDSVFAKPALIKRIVKADKDDHEKTIKREELLSALIAPGEVVHNTLITTYEPVKNEYIGVFSKIITLSGLFAD